VLEGIEAAIEAGLRPVKVNMVVRRGLNEHAVLPMAAHFRHRGPTLRFIEYMDVGATNGWRLEEVAPNREIREAIESRWPLEPVAPARPEEVATRYRYLDGAGEIGFISSVSNPFCGDCARARLSADGRLHTCLFATAGHDLRALLREGADDEEIAWRIERIWADRVDRYSVERSRMGAPSGAAPRVEMSFIGG
jgi:GTP 3',8-cyclase